MKIETVWVWQRWTRWPLDGWIVTIAAGVLALDVVTAWREISIGHLGRIPVPPALPFGLVLAGLVGWRRLGLDRGNLLAWREFLAVTGAVLVVGSITYVTDNGTTGEVLGLVLAALDEELVYRLAALIAIGAATAAVMGRDWRNTENWGMGPGIVALFGSGFVFALLPGHVEQMHDALGWVPFLSLGVVVGYAVLRTGALFPAVVVHASLNMVTIMAFVDGVPAVWRASFAAAALVALVIGTIVAGVRLGILTPMPYSVWRARNRVPS